MDVLNTTADDLYGDIDKMFTSQSSAVPQTETETSVYTSTSLNQSSSNHALTDKDLSDIVSDIAGNGDNEDMYDDFNLYDETIGEELQQRTDSHNELKKQCEFLMSKLTHLETENKSLLMKYNKTEQENLEAKRNIARLLLTTKGEISRKDKEIANLRMRLSASPRGRKNTALRRGGHIGSSSFSSIDSDFDPLCVSSPGNSELKRSSHIRFQSSQENTLSSLSNTENAKTAGSRSPHQGRNKEEEINRNSDSSAKSKNKHSRSPKEYDDVSRDNNKLKTVKSDDERKENIKSHNMKDSKIDEKSDVLYRSGTSSKLENEGKNSKSVPEKYQKADTKSHTYEKTVKTKNCNYSSDREVRCMKLGESSKRGRSQSCYKLKNTDASSENDKQNRMDIPININQTKLNDKSKVENVKCTDSDEKCDDANTKHGLMKTIDTGEKFTINVTSEKAIERSEDINHKIVISNHNDSVKSHSKAISRYETARKQIESSRKDRDRHKSGDARTMAQLERGKSRDIKTIEGERRMTERERNKRTDERKKVLDQDRAKSGNKKAAEDERRMNERVRQKSCVERGCETTVTECIGNSEPLARPEVLDLREKLRQKRLKSDCINNMNSAQNICMPKKGQTEAIQSLYVKKPVIVAEEVCNTSSSYEIDFLEYSNNEICEIWDAGENKETKEREPKHNKNTKKEEIVSNKKDGTNVIKSKTDKDARKEEMKNNPKKCVSLNEDLEFLNKLKSSIQRESLPSSSNPGNTHCASSKSDLPSETLNPNIKKRIEKSNVPSHCVKELHPADSSHQNGSSGDSVSVASSENNGNISETKSDSVTAEINNIKTSHHEKIESSIIDVAMNNGTKHRKETHSGNEKIKRTEAYQSSKSDNADSTSDTQAVCNKCENDEHIRNEMETISLKLSNAHTLKKLSDSDVSTSKTSSVQDIIAVSNKTDPEKCMSGADEYSLDLDESRSCSGVSSETVSSCTSSKMSKSVMEFFQSIDEKAEGKKNESVISNTSKSKSSCIDKQSSCNVKNCSIKMRHLHPKQSNKKSVPLKSDMDALTCGIENSENHKTEVESNLYTKSKVTGSHHINIKMTSFGSSSELCNNGTVQFDDMYPLKNASLLSTKSSLKGSTPLSVQTGNLEEKGLTSGTNETSTSIHETDVQLKCSSEKYKPDLLGKITDLKNSCISVNDSCEPDIEMEDLGVEGTAENESEGSFGSNIVSEKTESWRSSDDSDDSCSTYSGDSSSDEGDDGDSDSSIDDSDNASSLSHTSDTDRDDYISDLKDISGEKLVNKSTSDASSVNLTSITMTDKSVKRTECTLPLIKNSNTGMINRKLTLIDEHEKTSSPVATCSESISGTVSENDVDVKSNSVENRLNSCSENVIINEEKKSLDISKHVALNKKPALGNVNNGSSRSNMLLRLLNCVEKEFNDKKTFTVDEECPQEDNSKDDEDTGLDDINPEAEKDVTESVNIVKKCVQDKTCDENDQKSKDVEQVVEGISQQIQLKVDACNVKTNVNTSLNHGINSENTCEKLFGHPLSESSYSSSGSESDSDSGSSYSSHSSDCSTCSSSYSSDSSLSSDNDSEDEDNFTDNLKTVKQTQKNESVQLTHQKLNPNYKIHEAKSDSKQLFENGANEVFEEPSQALCNSSDRINEILTVLVEKSDSFETSDHDLPANLSAKNNIKSTEIPSIAKIAVPTQCKSSNKLHSQTYKTPATPSSVNNYSNNVRDETCVTHCRSGRKLMTAVAEGNCATDNKLDESLCSPTLVSPQTSNPYLIVDEIPEFMTLTDSNNKSSICELPRGLTKNISPKNVLASPAAVFISPKKGNADTSQTACNYSLGVIGSVDNEKDSVCKSNSVSLFSSTSDRSDLGAESSSHCIKETKHNENVDHREVRTTRSRNNSCQSRHLDITSKVTKKSCVSNVEIESRKPLDTSHSNIQKKDLGQENSPCSSGEYQLLDGHSQALFEAKKPSVTGQILRRSPRKTSSFTNHASLSATTNDKKTVTNDKHSSKKMYIDSAGALFGRALTENILMKKKNNHKLTKDKNLCGSGKKSEKKPALGKKSVNVGNVKSKLNATVNKQSEVISVRQTECKNIGKCSDKINDEQCDDSNTGKQAVKCVSDIRAGSAKKLGSSQNANTKEHGIDNKTTLSKGPVKLEHKYPKGVGEKSICLKKDKSNVTESQPSHPSCTLSSPLKKFTIPKLKRKASTYISPQDDQKFLGKSRKPLQTMSPLKSAPSICLKRTSDGKWLQTQSNTNTVKVSEINYCSSSDESSEDSSIVNALFGNCTDEKVVETHSTERQSEEGCKRKVKDSGSKADMVEKNEERLSKNRKSDHLSKDKNIKSVPSEPFLFLDEHTIDRTDYEDVLCLDNCDDDFNDDISNDSLEDGEISPASEPENKFQYVDSVPKNKSGEAKNVNSSKDVCNYSKNIHNKNGKTESNIKKLRVDDKVSQRYRQRNDDRKSPRYRNRQRLRSRSPRDSVFRSQSSYDRSRKYSKDSYLSPRDRRIRSHKRRRSRSNSRHRDSDSFRSKRRNTSLS